MVLHIIISIIKEANTLINNNSIITIKIIIIIRVINSWLVGIYFWVAF